MYHKPPTLINQRLVSRHIEELKARCLFQFSAARHSLIIKMLKVCQRGYR